jgi:hypothetical protein
MKEAGRNDSDCKPAMTGFAPCWFGTYQEGRQPFELLLPTSIVASVEEEVLHRATQARERERAALAAQRQRETEERKASTPPVKAKDESADEVDEAAFIAEFDRHPSIDVPSRVHQVLRGREVLDAVTRVRETREADYRKHDANRLDRIIKLRGFRAVANPGNDPDRMPWPS